MSRAAQTFHVWDEDEARTRVFEGPNDSNDNKGDEVPDRLARKVGAHVLDKPPAAADGDDVDTSAFDGEAFDAAVEAKAQELADQRAEEAVADYKQREQAAYDAATEGDPFDPSADGVKAADVKSYLEGLDRDTVAGSAEYDRVVQAETDGENRSTAFPKTD